MGLFDKKDPICIECGKKTNLLNRMVLKDNSCVCDKCAKIMPYEMRESATKFWTSEDWNNNKTWFTETQAHFHSIFNETDKYSEIHLDANNGLFYFGSKKLKPDNTVYDIRKISYYQFLFVPDEVKDGLLGTSAKGKSYLVFLHEVPFIMLRKNLSYYETASIETSGIFNKKYILKNPPPMEKFEDIFENVYVHLSEEFNEFVSSRPDSVILDYAKELFKIKDTNNVSIYELKSIRDDLFEKYTKDNDIENMASLSILYLMLKKEILKL